MAAGSSDQKPHYRHPDTTSTIRQIELDSDTWIEATEIDDDDLQFGGKSLSEWYEEERKRLSNGSSSSDEEERRGRQRVRKHYSSHNRHLHYQPHNRDRSTHGSTNKH
ncbi:hypothetical protein SODALDRAFT_324697 [Sodiomyces alkalinus F11]|uniref:Uncharacterized protein n=1 Tax=Sodiomyces alkalinus (strain CBS 110278 / VKM F-3762 / F11) TaxID=1314773 RepID=A0A3N2PUY0_SODAK|nr:hypothetical protein SODALDRAFT_324697 [Sodiomyces alkalinus F11]ROT38317.1 hypothetical protein SODALDRAFT_324697 [Sodiomyces alkalinus F11]